MPIIADLEYKGVDAEFYKVTLEAADTAETLQSGLAGPVMITISPITGGFYTQSVLLASALTGDGTAEFFKAAGAAARFNVWVQSINSRRLG